MPKRKGEWTLKDQLEALAYLVAIIGAISTAVVFLANARNEAIDRTRTHLLRTWTNEGDVTSTETRYIDLHLQNSDGDIIGTLNSPRIDNPLDVSVDVGWHSSAVSIVELRGRSVVPIATAKVRLTGNDNRLEWQVTSSDPPAFLPPSSVLWPLPAGVSQ